MKGDYVSQLLPTFLGKRFYRREGPTCPAERRIQNEPGCTTHDGSNTSGKEFLYVSLNGDTSGADIRRGYSSNEQKNLLYHSTECRHPLLTWPPYQGLWNRPSRCSSCLAGVYGHSFHQGTDTFISLSLADGQGLLLRLSRGGRP